MTTPRKSVQLDDPTPNTIKTNGSTPPPDDARDIASLWINAGIGDPLTTEHYHGIPIGRPKDFFFTAPSPAYRQRAEILVLKSENIIEVQNFLIGPKMRGRITEARPCVLITVVDRAGSPRLWPLMQPRDGEKDNLAWSSLRAIARLGMSGWVKAVWDGKVFVEKRAQAGYAPIPDLSHLPPFNNLTDAAFGASGVVYDETHFAFRQTEGLAPLHDDDEGGDDADPLL